MFRYGTSFSAVPNPDKPGTYALYSTITVWADGECVVAFEVCHKVIKDLPESHTTTDISEWIVEWADRFYEFATAHYAVVNRRHDDETNARPSDTSVPS